MAAVAIPAREAMSESVCGRLLDRRGVPLRGAAAWLLHPTYRKIGPIYSDPNGRFCFWRIRPNRTPYYLRIYWGSRLIYQKPLRVTANVNLPTVQF